MYMKTNIILGSIIGLPILAVIVVVAMLIKLNTDITNAFAKSTYRQRITHFTEELSFLSQEDKDWVMGRAILTRLGWT